jgi:hypothetical protein
MSKILFYFVSVYLGKVMIQGKDISKNALCSGVKSPVVRQSLLSQVAPDIGFLTQFFPSLIISRVTQNRGKYGIPNMKYAGLPALHEKQNVWNVIAKAVVDRFEGLQVCSEVSFS